MDIGKVIESTIRYNGSDVRRINHLIKVYGYAKTIGELEGLSAREQNILEVAAVLHDIGIKLSEEKYHSSAGKYQEIEGPAVADEILTELGYDRELIERVKYLIGHHHTYDQIEGIDYQILVEADFIVNISEDEMKRSAIESVLEKIFHTEAGKQILRSMYLSDSACEA